MVFKKILFDKNPPIRRIFIALQIFTVALRVKNALDSKRVEVYTNWENDNAKTEVAFVTASAQ